MSSPEQKDKRLKRMRSTQAVVEKRKRIIREIWKEDPMACFPKSPDGRLRKYNLACGCPSCRAYRKKHKRKGYGKRMHKLLKRGFNL